MTEHFSNKYYTMGVSISPAFPSEQSIVRITYNGLLVQKGAADVFAHVGYGYKWEKANDYKMSKTSHGYEVSIDIPRYTDRLNICFKDTANNWDNNAGANYSFEVCSLNVNFSFDYEHEVSMKME